VALSAVRHDRLRESTQKSINGQEKESDIATLQVPSHITEALFGVTVLSVTKPWERRGLRVGRVGLLKIGRSQFNTRSRGKARPVDRERKPTQKGGSGKRAVVERKGGEKRKGPLKPKGILWRTQSSEVTK